MSAARKKESKASFAERGDRSSKKRPTAKTSTHTVGKSKHHSSFGKDSDKQLQEHLGRFHEEAHASLSAAYESIQNKRRKTVGESRGTIKAQIETLKNGLADSTARVEALLGSSDTLSAALATAVQQLAEEEQRLRKCSRSPELETVYSKVQEELKREMAKVRTKAESDGK